MRTYREKSNQTFSAVSDQTDDAAERRPTGRQQPDETARAGRGPEKRGEGHAEPVDNRRVLRRLLDAAVHHQLRAGVLRRLSRARGPHARLHHPVAPQLGRQPAAVRVPPEGLPERVPVAVAVQEEVAAPEHRRAVPVRVHHRGRRHRDRRRQRYRQSVFRQLVADVLGRFVPVDRRRLLAPVRQERQVYRRRHGVVRRRRAAASRRTGPQRDRHDRHRPVHARVAVCPSARRVNHSANVLYDCNGTTF